MSNKINPPSLFKMLAQLWRHLSARRQRQFVFLAGLMLLSAFAEVVSLGAVVPFLGILTAPDWLFSKPLVADLARAWGIQSGDQLVLPLSIAFAASALIAGAIRLLLLWSSTLLAFSCGSDLSIDVYRRTLYQSYHVHLARNSSEVISGMTTKVTDVMFMVLLPVLTIISSSVLLIAIGLALLLLDPVVALAATAGLGGSYALITWISRRILRRTSPRIALEQSQVVKILQEGLGGIRDVLLDGSQPVFCDVYRKSDHALRRAQAINVFLGGSPRFAMEALGMTLFAALAYALSRQPGGIASALPALGALALGAQRLLPALQHAYAAWANIAGHQASLVDVVELLEQPLPADISRPAPLPFESSIRLENLGFRYAADGPWVLRDINLTIPKGARIGFVGITGSGKSTILDILMALLSPTEGRLIIDGQTVTDDCVRAWQRSIAHVPQSIFLADTTIAENIAFGIPPDAIDIERVRRAAQQAQIAEFIESTPESYAAQVGERGVRLSGGQRQRIGIARALYKQANVLIFDEATSALDNLTESSVMDGLEKLDRNLTVLLIAHRLTTVRHCDTIVELANGRIVGQGTYDELLQRSAHFRNMAGHAS